MIADAVPLSIGADPSSEQVNHHVGYERDHHHRPGPARRQTQYVGQDEQQRKIGGSPKQVLAQIARRIADRPEFIFDGALLHHRSNEELAVECEHVFENAVFRLPQFNDRNTGCKFRLPSSHVLLGIAQFVP